MIRSPVQGDRPACRALPEVTTAPVPRDRPRLWLSLPRAAAVLGPRTLPVALLGLGEPMGSPQPGLGPRKHAELAMLHRLASLGP